MIQRITAIIGTSIDILQIYNNKDSSDEELILKWNLILPVLFFCAKVELHKSTISF